MWWVDVGSRPRVTSHTSATGGVRSQKWPRSHKECASDGSQISRKKGKTHSILVARTRWKKEKKIACPLLDVFACRKVLSPRLYRLTITNLTIRPYCFSCNFQMSDLIMNLQLTLRHSSILASQGLSDPTDIAEAEAAKKAKSFIMQKILNF